MARQRLGVVLLVPQPTAAQVDGLRRALGDGALARIEPHITLVPPVNVPDRDLPATLAIVRAAAEKGRPLSLRLGPVATFAPVNPVAYLAVSGGDDDLSALHELRTGLRTGVLDRPDPHDFVPHVTVADELAPERIDAAVHALRDFSADVSVDRVHVLAQQPDRRWVPIADAALGGMTATIGRGSLPLDVTVTARPDLEAAMLLAVDQEAPGQPFAVTARRDGSIVAAAWGWTAAGRLEVADLVVATQHRGQGIGRHLIRAVEALASERGCRRAGGAAPALGPAASLLRAAGWETLATREDAGSVAGGGPATAVRWERAIPGDDER